MSDTGPVIPPNGLEQVFEPFTQLDSSTTRRHGGAGMSLAVACRLTELTVAGSPPTVPQAPAPPSTCT